MSPNWIFLPLLARNENVTGCREVPIHLELNSVPSRASRAAIHPAAGSCLSPGMRGWLPARGDARAWPDTERLGSVLSPGGPQACRGICGQCMAVLCQEVVLGSCALGLGRTRALGTLPFPGSRRGLPGVGAGDAGSWQGGKEPSTKSRWKSRELWFRKGRILSQEQHAGEASEKDRPQFLPEE